MRNTNTRLVRAAEATEARTLSLLARLKEVAEGLIDLDDLLDIDKPRLARAVEGEEDESTDPEDTP